MQCEDFMPLIGQFATCVQTELGTEFITHCLYPSADPVLVYVQRRENGFTVSDGGGALRSALAHGRSIDGFFESASKRYSVAVRGGMLIAEPSNDEWLYPAVLAVSNASAMAARLAIEASISKSERTLKTAIFDGLKAAVPASKIGKDFEYRGRSGHVWQVDFAVREESLILIKSVVQNGNSINSSYATFGDIGDHETVSKFCVFESPLNQDTESLLRQVAELVPVGAITPMTQNRAYGRRLNS